MRRWLAALLLAACDGWPESPAPPAPVQMPPGTVVQGHAAREAALTAPGPPVTAALVAEGAELWRVFCTPCHGVRGAGDGVVVRHGHPPIAPVPRDAARAVAALRGNLAGTHPIEGRLAPREIWAVARYLERLP